MNLKSIFLLSLLLSLIACKTNHQSLESEKQILSIKSSCPEDGNCNFEVIENRKLDIKTDGTGALYPQLSDGKSKVLKFEYNSDQDPRIADDEYTEIIYIEINPKIQNLRLEDKDLKDVQILFGRLCFCREQSGYFTVEKGAFQIETNKDKSVTYTLEFEVPGIPQKIKEFSITNW